MIWTWCPWVRVREKKNKKKYYQPSVQPFESSGNGLYFQNKYICSYFYKCLVHVPAVQDLKIETVFKGENHQQQQQQVQLYNPLPPHSQQHLTLSGAHTTDSFLEHRLLLHGCPHRGNPNNHIYTPKTATASLLTGYCKDSPSIIFIVLYVYELRGQMQNWHFPFTPMWCQGSNSGDSKHLTTEQPCCPPFLSLSLCIYYIKNKL